MKAISLLNPWAMLVAIGEKRYETRSWATSYRGRLYVHASKGFPGDCAILCDQHVFASALGDAGYGSWRSLPCGVLLASVDLVGCCRVESVRDRLTAQERAFGDYSDGRFAWVFENVQRLPEPIPAKGSLGLWTISPETAVGIVPAATIQASLV